MNSPIGTVLASLARLGGLYPSGVPSRLIRKPRVDNTESLFIGASAASLMFLAVDADLDQQLRSQEGALLSAAITKGLKRDLTSTLVVLAPHDKAPEMENLGAQVCVALGVEAAKLLSSSKEQIKVGQLIKIDSMRQLIVAHSLKAVLESAEIKREFWQQLQKADQILRELKV